MNTNSTTQPHAAGQAAHMTALSDDLTHFFANDHFLVKKALHVEGQLSVYRDSRAALVEALSQATELMEMHGIDTSRYAGERAILEQCRAALAAAKA